MRAPRRRRLDREIDIYVDRNAQSAKGSLRNASHLIQRMLPLIRWEATELKMHNSVETKAENRQKFAFRNAHENIGVVRAYFRTH